MSYIGRTGKLSQRAYNKVSFLATAGQTIKTGLSYVAGFVEVYLNGVLLTDTVDYTATNGNSVTFVLALNLDDEITIISLKTFVAANMLSLSGGTITGDLGVVGTVTAGEVVVDGTALATGAFTAVGTAATVNTGVTTGTLPFAEDVVLIQPSGNVGIGTNSALATLSIKGTTNELDIETSATGVTLESIDRADDTKQSDMSFYARYGNHKFFSGAYTERMRIDNQGRLLLNTSSAIFAASEALHIEGIESGTASYGIFAHGSAGTNYFVRAYRGDNLSGSISYTANGLFLTSVSDERLKENISNANDAGEKIDAINVRQFDWKQSGDHQEYGMIAQELIKVAPDAVHAPEDPEDMMAVDYAKLVPMLIKEVQSLRARVSALESN